MLENLSMYESGSVIFAWDMFSFEGAFHDPYVSRLRFGKFQFCSVLMWFALA
jgi:hypothetical protein